MVRRLAYILVPLALLFVAACSDDKETDTDTNEPTAISYAAPTDASSDGDDDNAQPTTAIGDTDTDPGDTGDGASKGLLGTLNPLDLLSAAGSGEPSSGPADPSLQAPLLTQADLPGGFFSLGDFSYNVPSEYGDVHMAASMFASGDMASQELGAMVMSAVVAVPPEAIDELGDPSDWADAGNADLDELRAVFDETGLGLSDLSLLDASGLGEGGLGMHLTMDFGGLFDALGAPDDANPFAEGISMDMYMFLRGDRMLMTIVMWPAGAPSGVDGHSLAERMDERAIAAPASR